MGPVAAPSTARRSASVVVEFLDKLSAKIAAGEVTLGRCSTSTTQLSMTAMRCIDLMKMEAESSFFRCLLIHPYTRLMLSTCSRTALFRSLPGMVTKGSRRPTASSVADLHPYAHPLESVAFVSMCEGQRMLEKNQTDPHAVRPMEAAPLSPGSSRGFAAPALWRTLPLPHPKRRLVLQAAVATASEAEECG